MAKYTWYNEKVPQGIEIKQVYGIIFSSDGRMLLKIENDYYCLAGGKPESFDKDMTATLRRELIEEINTTIKPPIYLGYQLVDEQNGKKPYAQVRMIALIDKIGCVKPDPDNGKTYQRFLTNPQKAIKLLNWGFEGEKMINCAVELAKQKLGITKFADNDEYV